MRLFVIDAFTDVPFRGNPAGVVLLDAPAEPSWMQAVAAELKHSETAFVRHRDDGDYDLRWFTPATEVDLCGHATLAAAHALASADHAGPFAFHTRSGVLRCHLDAAGVVEMEFPAQPGEPIEEPPGLAAALGVAPKAVVSNGIDVLVEVENAAAVAELAPDIERLRGVECRGVIVTARADTDADHDFVSRFFAPRVGVDEDPVTGSAHCKLGPYWS
ncbi:MAG TPA: PhzF family phenazine biosynthesis protein, partial [Jatrophihabitans sp.]|nr:PhzF family phenazine biosynthesis protein [Jatrophihabitans sp.]